LTYLHTLYGPVAVDRGPLALHGPY